MPLLATQILMPTVKALLPPLIIHALRQLLLSALQVPLQFKLLARVWLNVPEQPTLTDLALGADSCALLVLK
jgi:hypothetical protein